MNLLQILAEAFHNGDYFICHWERCDGGHDYTVELPEGTRLFEITEHNYKHIQSAHPTEYIEALECGCVCHHIIPNTVTESEPGFSLN